MRGGKTIGGMGGGSSGNDEVSEPALGDASDSFETFQSLDQQVVLEY